jgi:hypothetical protein
MSVVWLKAQRVATIIHMCVTKVKRCWHIHILGATIISPAAVADDGSDLSCLIPPKSQVHKQDE